MEITDYRYHVRAAGHTRTDPGDFLPTYTAVVVDSWTEDVMVEFRANGAEAASLLAETRCAEMNAPMVALEFVSRLGLHMERVRNEMEGDTGDLCEDVDKILEWHVAALRGLTRKPLAQESLYYQAPGLG